MTAFPELRSAVRGWPDEEPVRRTVSDDGGSMPLALLLTLVAMSLSALTLPAVLVQVNGTRSTVARSAVLNVAYSGLEVALAAVRAAYGPGGAGDRRQLPCGPIENGFPARAESYRVDLVYYSDDPALAGATVMSCEQARTDATVPRFVRMTSRGQTNTGTPSRRTLRGDYPLRFGPAGHRDQGDPAAV